MPRRGNNEGTITKRTDGRWEARLTLPNGKRKSFYGKTRSEVAQLLTKAQHDLSRGLPVVAEKLTVAAYLESWLAGMMMQVDASTWRRYEDQVIKHIIPVLGKTVLSRLTAQQLMNLYTVCVSKGLSHATVRHLHGVMHHALDDAVDLSLVQKNVADQAKPPRAKQAEIQPFTEDQANHFLASLAGHRMEALYVLALTTGMREGELLALHWQDVYLERKELYVRVTIQETHHEYGKKAFILAEPKTDKSKRHIVLGDVAITALKIHRVKQKTEKFAVGDAWQENGLVFPNELGVLYKPSTIYQQYQKLLRLAGLPRRRFHDLRHTCATILLAHGIPVKQVSEMLGHSDIAITLRVYGRAVPSMHQATADTMDSVFHRQAQ